VLGLWLGVELGSKDGFEDTEGTSEASHVGPTLGEELGLLLEVKLGPEEGFEEPVGKSEATRIGSMLERKLGRLCWESSWAQKTDSKSP
jgi:hypothetical protein